jgi:hypothetical protein
MSLRPGDAFAFKVVTQDGSGAAANADSLPSALVVRNGTDDATPVVTVTNPATGEYALSLTVPVGYVAGDAVQVKITATVGGIVSKFTTQPEILDTIRVSQVVTVLFATLVESGITFAQLCEVLGAFAAGKRSNAGTVNERYDALNNPGTVRIVGNLDSAGNGTPTLTL